MITREINPASTPTMHGHFSFWLYLQTSETTREIPQPDKYLYYAGTFWLYLHIHCRLRNVTLVRVSCAYNGDFTMAMALV
jgi:hypothetical protein